jgi:hypothetical protein
MLRAAEGDGLGKAGARAIVLEFADELPAVVGLPDQVLQIDAAALEMALDAMGEQGAGAGRAARGIGEEL